nr:MAG TPA: hypothetical protein [Caudoviricetes sp.]
MVCFRIKGLMKNPMRNILKNLKLLLVQKISKEQKI